MDVQTDSQETVSITFEWTLRGLKTFFDSSKGETKSKVTKSPKFGGGRWQVLFYANAGPPKDGPVTDGGCISLYLSCEPTAEEREAAIADSGRWVRDGVYKFTFELRNVGKTALYNSKEASNHTFSHKSANWGWAQFARRDAVYYQATSAKAHDAFVIVCNITSTPSPPGPHPSKPRRLVPADLLTTLGDLLDDPNYSDVEFIIPRPGQGLGSARSIFASRKVLKRTDYFDSMFSSGFAESALSSRLLELSDSESLALSEFDDSDEEDEKADDPVSSPMEEEPNSPPILASLESSTATITENAMELEEDTAVVEDFDKRTPVARSLHDSHPSSPCSVQSLPLPTQSSVEPPRRKVIVKDFAYTTYYAVLFYIYTDTIIFAPLSSSFLSSNRIQSLTQATVASSIPTDQTSTLRRNPQRDLGATRREWIKKCFDANPDRPEPCSAKSVYRLADLMGLHELKERASQHILKSLTVENIAYEVFSPFAAAFGDIRRAEVDFFLKHWKDIRSSDAMRNVWKQIRNGRHPGFEEVWPVIASSLEFVPPAASDDQSMTAAGDR